VTRKPSKRCNGVAVLPRGLSMDRTEECGAVPATWVLVGHCVRSRTHAVLEHCLSRAFSVLIIIDIMPGVLRRVTARDERVGGE